MNKKNAGNKPTYTNEQLIDVLNKYIRKYPNKKIKLSELERETKISRNIWKYNKKIRAIIDNMNNPPIIAPNSNLNFTLPNAEQLVNVHYNNKPKLIKAIQDCFDIINDLIDLANIGYNTEQRETEFLEQIKELKAQIDIKNQEVDKLNKEIDDLYLDSSSPLSRRRKGIKDNMIELTPERIKALSKKEKDIEEEYKGLFD